MTEFELIRTYFASRSLARNDVIIGIGDDAAVVRTPPSTETVVTTDAMVAGVHFFEDVEPAALGHKALAVNLSDLAAMGAEPAWFLLDLIMPNASTSWLESFAEGLFALARAHNVQLIGGDTSRGPLSIAITAIGHAPPGKTMRRSGARVGDGIYVSGELGDAALTLAHRRGEHEVASGDAERLRTRLERPTPRVASGVALRDIASSAIDVSDGLIADLGHICRASGVGARIELAAIPLSSVYRNYLAKVGWDYALAGGDGYELCFTVAPASATAVETIARQTAVPLTRIGEITRGVDVEIYDDAGRLYRPATRGYDHFAVTK